MIDKGEERFGLCKVPDKIVIKQLKIELGKANAYIAELEYKLKNKNVDKSNLEKKISDYFAPLRKRYKDKIKALQDEVRNLKHTIDTYINKK